MALKIGDISASDGMSKAIYDKLREVMEPIAGVSGEDLEQMRNSWRKLAFAIADGVVTHIKSNMEIKKIKIIENVKVKGDTSTNNPNAHKHEVDIEAKNEKLEFTELDYSAGQGHVK